MSGQPPSSITGNRDKGGRGQPVEVTALHTASITAGRPRGVCYRRTWTRQRIWDIFYIEMCSFQMKRKGTRPCFVVSGELTREVERAPMSAGGRLAAEDNISSAGRTLAPQGCSGLFQKLPLLSSWS